MQTEVIKKVAAVALILVTGGAWLYLDYQNKQEQLAAEQARKELDQLRAQAQAKAAARAKFETQIQAALDACKADAEKAKEAFLDAKKQPVKRKPGQFTIPQAAQDEAAKVLNSANAACQVTHDARLAQGS